MAERRNDTAEPSDGEPPERAVPKVLGETLPSLQAMVPCPKCKVVTPIARYCTACGGSLAPRRFCSECGARLKPAAAACVECGAMVQ